MFYNQADKNMSVPAHIPNSATTLQTKRSQNHQRTSVPWYMTGEEICFHLLCSLFNWLHFSIGSWCWQSFNKPLPGVNSEHVFVEGQRGELMRSTVRGSGEFSVKCQWNVKCLSKTLSAFCGLAGGLASLSCVLDYSELEEGSFYISAPQQPSFRRPAGIYTTLTHKQKRADKHTI